MKKIAKIVGAMALAAGLLGATSAAHAGTSFTFTWDPNLLWNTWSSIQQADGACVPFPLPQLSSCGDFVRGNVSKRHARDRLFYNTTSNYGAFDRSMQITCRPASGGTNYNVPAGFPRYDVFNTQNTGGGSTYGDLTLTCNGGDTMINYGVTVTAY